VIKSLIAQGLNAIAISANGRSALVSAMKKHGRGITVISSDSSVAKDGHMMHLTPFRLRYRHQAGCRLST
jgi:rhamnose transport system substrate-binding protein